MYTNLIKNPQGTLEYTDDELCCISLLHSRVTIKQPMG